MNCCLNLVEESKQTIAPDFSLQSNSIIIGGNPNEELLVHNQKDSRNCLQRMILSNGLERISEAPFQMEVESEMLGGINSRIFRDNSSNMDFNRLYSNSCNEQKLIEREASNQFHRKIINTDRKLCQSQNLILKQVLINDCIEITPEPEEYVFNTGEENISDEIQFENIQNKYSAAKLKYAIEAIFE